MQQVGGGAVPRHRDRRGRLPAEGRVPGERSGSGLDPRRHQHPGGGQVVEQPHKVGGNHRPRDGGPQFVDGAPAEQQLGEDAAEDAVALVVVQGERAVGPGALADAHLVLAAHEDVDVRAERVLLARRGRLDIDRRRALQLDH
jgi:hypothetical protein